MPLSDADRYEVIWIARRSYVTGTRPDMCGWTKEKIAIFNEELRKCRVEDDSE